MSRLRLLTDAELRTTLVEWNDTATDLPAQGCLHEAFEARADAAPDAVAVVQGADRLTYGEVNAAANRLAHHLRSLGVGPDDRVGLCLDRSAQLLVAELAVLKAGGADVPLDPDYPASRIATMVTGTSCAVMVSRTDLTGNLPRTDGTPLVLLDRDADLLRELPGHNPGRLAGPDHLCYIIHTSGSTGAPSRSATAPTAAVLNNGRRPRTRRYGVGPGDTVPSRSPRPRPASSAGAPWNWASPSTPWSRARGRCCSGRSPAARTWCSARPSPAGPGAAGRGVHGRPVHQHPAGARPVRSR
ncbi:D-alanine--D-alanyl carrier protein ligase [Streptomyces violaceorubidus]